VSKVAFHERTCVLALLLACDASPSVSAPPATAAPAPAASEPPAPTTASDPVRADAPAREIVVGDAWIEELLRETDRFDLLLADPARYRLQILVTELDPRDTTRPLFTHGYRVDAELFFAASAIKTFASVAALRKLAFMHDQGVDLSTPLVLCTPDEKECTQDVDRTNLPDRTITLGHELRKMHLVSNNRAFNRLYDFVGQREINEDLRELGFESVRLRHRMGEQWTTGAVTPRMELRGSRDVVVVPRRESGLDDPPTAMPGVEVGVAYHGRARRRIDRPRDFSRKNYASMLDLHRLQLAVVYPRHPGVPELGLEPEHRAFLLEAMSQDPEDSQNPRFDSPRLAGPRYKPMSAGIARVLALDGIRYVNKPGRAYGFHIENACVEDTRRARAFCVTAGVYVNENGVINDDHYEYDSISRPFFKDLGEVLARRLLLEPGQSPP
jgi:hypothetical protein